MTYASGVAAARFALVALVFGCAGVARAQTQLYFVEYQFQNPKIKSMGLLGQSPQELFTIPATQWLPLDLTYDAAQGFLYWTDGAGTNEVVRALPDGSMLANVLTASGSARGPGVDAQGRLYYTDGNTIRRANANGSGVAVLFTAVQTFPLGCPLVDATNGHVYFGADASIWRMNLDGSNLKRVVSGVSRPRSLALDVANSTIYWTDADTISDFVGRCRLDDTQFTVLVDHSPAVVQSPGVVQLLIDPAHNALYYCADLFQSQIFRAGPDGSNVAAIYTSPTNLAPSGLVLDTGPIAQPVADCNHNGVADAVDIANGTSLDCDDDGFPDDCEDDPCPARTFYVDNGSNPAANSRTVGCAAASAGSCFEVFQPFDVPAPGWAVREIGLDGWTANYAFGAGFTATLLPDDGTGTFANEGAPIAVANFQFRFDPDGVNWAYQPLPAALPAGRYWVRLSGGEPLYHGAVNAGTAGLPSKSRSGAGGITTSVPVALRIVQGALAGSPVTVSLTAGGAQELILDAGVTHANQAYWLLGSVTGTTPGLPLNPEVHLPLNYDAYLLYLLQAPNAPPLLYAFGVLDGTGKAAAQFVVPPSSPTVLAGLAFHHAYVVIGAGSVPLAASPAVPLVLTP